MDPIQLENQLRGELRVIERDNIESLIECSDMVADLRATLSKTVQEIGFMEDWLDVYHIQLGVRHLLMVVYGLTNCKH